MYTNIKHIKKYNYVKVDLQKFAGGSGEKTEKATPKKRQDARKKGQVLQSREITSASSLIAIFIGIKLFGSYMYYELQAFTKKIILEYPKIEDFASINVITKIFIDSITAFLKVMAPVFVIAIISAIGLSVAQVGFLFTTETLGIKFERINPLSGLKRMFSLRTVYELIKSLIKIVIVLYIAYSYIKSQSVGIMSLMSMEAFDSAIYIGSLTINLAIRMCVALIILSFFDFLYQWFEHEKSLKMSKQEIKEEYKQTEGNPEIKAKIRQKQRQISMSRMMSDVPKADVIITNPTHFAVAIRYDIKISDAPVVIAKGQDYIAFRIKEIAKENKVYIVENKPLARTIYDTVEVGDKIPEELYQAVAEILAFVYSLKNKVG